MVEKTSDSSDSDVELFDSSVRQHLRGVRNNGIGLCIVGGSLFVVQVLCHYGAVICLAGMAVHTCAFTGLLAKNMVSKLVLLGGKPFRV